MLKPILQILPVAYFAMSIASAQNPFVGEWKLDPSKSRLPDEMRVEKKGGNTYAFDFGGLAETVVVDGSDQPGLDGTLLSVKAEAPDTWIVKRTKGNRLLLSATWKLSNNGSTLTDHFREFAPDGSTLSIDYVYGRTAEGTGFAADWQSVKETINSPFSMTVKEFQGDGLSFVSPLGTTNAQFEGKDHPNEGPSAGRGSSSIRRLDERTLLLTIKRDGKVAATEDVTLSADLKNMTLTVHMPGRDRPNVLVFERR